MTSNCDARCATVDIPRASATSLVTSRCRKSQNRAIRLLAAARSVERRGTDGFTSNTSCAALSCSSIRSASLSRWKKSLPLQTSLGETTDQRAKPYAQASTLLRSSGSDRRSSAWSCWK